MCIRDSVGDERTSHASQIQLAFDYYPVIDAQESSKSSELGDSSAEKATVTSNGSTQSKEESVPRFVKYDPDN